MMPPVCPGMPVEIEMQPQPAYQDLLVSFETGQVDAKFRHNIVRGVLDELDTLIVFVEDFHVDAQALQLFDQNFKGFGNTRLHDIFTLDDGFIGLDTTHHVVGFDGQNFLQNVGRAISFQRPHFHLTEGLLRDQAIRASRAGMHLVFDQVGQLEHVGVANRDRLVERLACAPIKELHLARSWKPGALQVLLDVLFGRAIEDRRGDLEAQGGGSPTQVRLHDLTDIHTVRHAKRVEDDIDRGAIRQERHILNRQHAGNDAFVAVASGHLVARANLALLGDAHAHQLVDARRQFVAGLTREQLDFDDLAALAVWHAQRSILHLTRLLTKDGAQQLLFRRQFGFPFGGDLADQDVLGADLRANVDDAALVQVAQAFLTHVRNVAGDLLGAKLGIASVDLILFNMDRGEEVFAHDALANQDGVLEVAAFPAHKGHQNVLPKRQFAKFSG